MKVEIKKFLFFGIIIILLEILFLVNLNYIKNVGIFLCFIIYFYFREIFVSKNFPESNSFFRFIKKYNQPIGFLFGLFGVILLFSLMFFNFII